jgi:hypothetical protein
MVARKRRFGETPMAIAITFCDGQHACRRQALAPVNIISTILLKRARYGAAHTGLNWFLQIGFE